MTYELFEVARLILDKEDRLSIVIRHLEAEQRPDALLAVSVPDGHPFLSEGDAVSHVMSRHLDKFFDVVEVEVEAPKGSFLMVAKCPQTGKLLGAPTHHSYQRNLREHHARHCPNVPFDSFKGRLEMVREQEQIDAWLKSMSTRSEYAPKDRKEGEPERLESLDAARGFLQAFRKDLVVKTHPWIRFAGRLLEEMNPGPLRDSVRYALEQQRAFPLDTANGIRGRYKNWTEAQLIAHCRNNFMKALGLAKGFAERYESRECDKCSAAHCRGEDACFADTRKQIAELEEMK
jgi:hypothetical protein